MNIRQVSTTAHPYGTSSRFEHILATRARVQTLECLHITTPLHHSVTATERDGSNYNTTGSTPTSAVQPPSQPPNNTTLVISGHSSDPVRALSFQCPHGGVSFQIQKSWKQEANTVHVRALHSERHDVSGPFVLSAKQTDWTSGAVTIVADRMRLQSSMSPFDVHSFSTDKQGIALRCPKGGIALSSGTGGIQHTTTGDVDVRLDGENTHLRLASRGHRTHTIHLGNERSETIVENQLTVKGKLVLADTTAIEKRVSVIHELQNVIELGGLRTHNTTPAPAPTPRHSSSNDTDIAGQNAASPPTVPSNTPSSYSSLSHPDACGYDFGVVAAQHNRKAGMVFDHTKQMFYFGTDLGLYQHHRFAPPNSYADVQARAFVAQQKLYAPFVDARAVKCRSVRSDSNQLSLQAPLVKCSEELVCSSFRSELVQCTRIQTHAASTEELDVTGNTVMKTIHIKDSLRLGDGQFRAEKWWQNTVGANGMYPTLQDWLDATECRDIRESSDFENSAYQGHVVMEATHIPHHCNATINCPILTIDGRHSTLTGTFEITNHCESLLIVDAQLDLVSLTSLSEHGDERSHRPSKVVLRNVSGTAKDWSFDMPGCTLRLEHCAITFTNSVLGTLKSVEEVMSVVRGTPWKGLDTGVIVKADCGRHSS